ncbi:uncharacterized protein [Branchiostoma lanceolatum]|uniref:uncharacterized protein n=1 Tax=Branchiostoma lanceolatum TaxID=7740 RepID=UPI00345206D8
MSRDSYTAIFRLISFLLAASFSLHVVGSTCTYSERTSLKIQALERGVFPGSEEHLLTDNDTLLCSQYRDFVLCSSYVLHQQPGCSLRDLPTVFPTFYTYQDTVGPDCHLPGRGSYAVHRMTKLQIDGCKRYVCLGMLQNCSDVFLGKIAAMDQDSLCTWPGDQIGVYVELNDCVDYAQAVTNYTESLLADQVLKRVHETAYGHCKGKYKREREPFDPPDSIFAVCVSVPAFLTLVAAVVLASWDYIRGKQSTGTSGRTNTFSLDRVMVTVDLKLPDLKSP